MKRIIVYLPLIIFMAILCSAGGYFYGRYSERQDQLAKGDAPEEVTDRKKEVAQGVDNQTEASKVESNVILPADLANAKNVPEKISNPQGDYTFVSVVEGAQVNQQLSDNLRLVAAQRQQLGKLAKQFQKTTENSVQQRELLAGEINEVKMSLQRNLVVIARSYSYTLANTYLRVPHVVTLLSVTKKGDKFETKPVHTFTSADDYLAFQKKNDTYQRMKLEIAQAGKAKPSDESQEPQDFEDELESAPVAPTPAEIKVTKALVKQTADLRAMQAEMAKNFKFNPEERYLLQFEKTALYARPVK